MILLLSLILLGCYCFHLWETYSYWRRRGVVGPTPWPIVGNYGQVLFRLKSEDKLIRELYEQYPDEKFIGVFVGRTPVLVIKDLKMVKQVLTKDFKYFPDRLTSVTFMPFKKSIFVSPGNNAWFKKKKTFAVLYNNNQISKLLDAIQDSSTKYLDYIEERISVTTKQNICKLQEDLFFVISSDAMLGKKMYTSYDKTSKLQKEAKMIAKFELVEARYCMELIFPEIFILCQSIIKFIGLYIFNSTLKLIYSALIHRRNSNLESNIKSTFSDIVLELQEANKLNKDTVIDDESLTIHMTAITLGLTVPTSHAAVYLCYELAQNPDIQNKCYEEINQVMKKFDGKLTLEAMLELKHLDMAIEEELRKYGAQFVINRMCKTKYRFPNTTVEVDPGVIVLAPGNAFRNDPKYFQNPKKFIPERFSPENKNKTPAYANLTFGYGLRQCIGKSIAKQVILMSMALFLHRFKIEPSEQTPDELTYDDRYTARVPRPEESWMNVVKRQ